MLMATRILITTIDIYRILTAENPFRFRQRAGKAAFPRADKQPPAMNSFIQSILNFLQQFLQRDGNSGPSRPDPKAPSRPATRPQPAPSPEPTPPPQPTAFDTPPVTPAPAPTPPTPEPAPTPAPAPAPTPAATTEPVTADHGLRMEKIFKGPDNQKLKAIKVTDGEKEGVFPHFASSRNSWKGWYTRGERDIKDFVRNEPALLRELDMTQSAQNLLQAVSDNEGNLEAINAYDGAFLSFGIFQWTLGTRDNAGELPALLKKIKSAYPAAFYQHFGRYGIDVSSDTNAITGFLTLDGKLINKRALKEQFRSAEWVYRFWRAGLNREVQAIELDHGLSRLKTFYWRYKVHGFTLNEIVTSEYGVALLLDNHVNLPALVKKALEAAMTETGLTDPTNWDTAEERRVIDAYIKHRATRVGGFGPMYDAIDRAKRTAKYLTEGIISDERNSFVASNTSTRSIDDMGNFVPEPEDYKPSDYPDVELDTEGRDMEFLSPES
jgi:hypothetical protein